MKVSKKQALSIFLEQWREVVKNGQFRANDVVAKREAWNNYTDMLCKDNMITDNQYNTWVNPF